MNMEIKAPQNVKNVLNELVQELRNILGDNLVGIYLHGSLAMGGFNPASSDIDIIVVAKDKLISQVKVDLRAKLQLLSKRLLSKGFDMSVVKLNVLKQFEHPTPYEFYFHYSNIAANKQIEDDGAYDSNLTIHFAITKERGICLYGKPIAAIFPDVPKLYYLQSIAHDAEWSLNNIQKGPDTGKCLVPVYAVLNFCRALAFIKEELIASKIEGAEWGLEHLPEEYKPLIQEALEEYKQSSVAKEVDAVLLKRFAAYSWNIIKNVG